MNGFVSFIACKTFLVKVSTLSGVANVLGCDIVVYRFELLLRYYVHFRTNALELNSFVSFIAYQPFLV